MLSKFVGRCFQKSEKALSYLRKNSLEIGENTKEILQNLQKSDRSFKIRRRIGFPKKIREEAELFLLDAIEGANVSAAIEGAG